MATWFTVYSPKSLRHVTPAALAAYLRGPKIDWHTVAEMFGIEDEAVVDRAAEAVRVEPATGALGEWFMVRYRPARFRPLVVSLWADPARVREELAEAEEECLDGRAGRGVGRVRTALSAVTEVAAVDLGHSQLADMGVVIAGQVAEYLAGAGEGVIRDPGDEWWAVRGGISKLLLANA